MGYRWSPSKSERRAYYERMKRLEEEQDNIPDDYPIPCTGDCCTGDKITFFNAAKSDSRFYGEIISESYGKDKQQHTFTVLLQDNSKMLIKGRNLYKKGVFRKQWDNETQRDIILSEKHERGDKARDAARERKMQKEMRKLYGNEDIYNENYNTDEDF